MTNIKTEGYTNVMCVLGRCYLFSSFFANEDITDQVVHVALLENYTKGTNSFDNLRKTVLYTAGGGPFGFLIALMSGQPKVHIECIIYLEDKREIHVETKDLTLVKFLFQFMNVYKKRRYIK